jgi:hypothetical protein
MTWTCACGASWAGPASEAFPDLAVREWQRHHGRLPRTEYRSHADGVHRDDRHRWEVRE